MTHAYLIHLVCGSTGAGKTTYAFDLTARLNAVRFSIDEWMASLFWMDAPQPISASWAQERVTRCNTQIWEVARQVATRGIPCVMDLGFTQAQDRADMVKLAHAAGLGVQLHFLDVPVEERWRRVERRNAQKGETYQLSFDVTRDMFDYVETLWEPPTPPEMAALAGIHITTT